MSELETYLKGIVRDVPDFPKPGILFKDITPVLEDAAALKRVIDHMADTWRGEGIDRIVGIESRGFIFGTALAYALDLGIAVVRKPGKLPYTTTSVTYDLEYGTDTLHIHTDAIAPGMRVLIVDDLLATGGTASATGHLVEKLGGTVAGCAFVIELGFLDGRAKLKEWPVRSILTY